MNEKEYFIKSIELSNIRYLEKFDIPLGDSKRKHLLFTGKNGCGKTTTLREINILLDKLFNNQFQTLESYHKELENVNNNMKNYKNKINNSLENIRNFNEEINKIKHNKEADSSLYINQLNNNIHTENENIINNKNNILNWTHTIKHYESEIEKFGKVNLNFTNQFDMYDSVEKGKFIMAYFEAKRINEPHIPQNIQKVNLNKRNSTDTQQLHNQFIQYIVSLRMEMLDAKEENDDKEVSKIKNWFINLEYSLKELFDKNDLTLKYNRKNFNYYIKYDNKSFGLNELSDGYSAVLSIITELILRMEAHNTNSYDLQGVVLIDEIETHLHVSLQKKILPFLTTFFPKIQFIVTTHSPFVLSSLNNTVICDLERREIVEDLSAYSYDALIESYFNNDKYSIEVKEKIERFENLSEQLELNEKEKNEFDNLKKYFKDLPKFMADELAVKINEILLNSLGSVNK